MMNQVIDYEGKISSIVKRADSVCIETIDGMIHDMDIADYISACEFAGFNPRKRSVIRGFRVLNKAGEDVEYKYYFVR